MNKQKKFGLVFEERLPECTPLYEMPVKCGSNVALKSGNINEIYRVIAIDNEILLQTNPTLLSLTSLQDLNRANW